MQSHLILEDESGVEGLLVLEEVVCGLHKEVVGRLHPGFMCDRDCINYKRDVLYLRLSQMGILVQ